MNKKIIERCLMVTNEYNQRIAQDNKDNLNFRGDIIARNMDIAIIIAKTENEELVIECCNVYAINKKLNILHELHTGDVESVINFVNDVLEKVGGEF